MEKFINLINMQKLPWWKGDKSGYSNVGDTTAPLNHHLEQHDAPKVQPDII